MLPVRNQPLFCFVFSVGGFPVVLSDISYPIHNIDSLLLYGGAHGVYRRRGRIIRLVLLRQLSQSEYATNQDLHRPRTHLGIAGILAVCWFNRLRWLFLQTRP